MRHTAREPEHRPQGDAVPSSKERTIGDSPGESPQRAVFSAQQIVGEVQRAQHV